MQKHEIFRFTAANKPAEEKTFALTNVIAVNKTIKRHRKKKTYRQTGALWKYDISFTA